jgi:hypothetical protein
LIVLAFVQEPFDVDCPRMSLMCPTEEEEEAMLEVPETKPEAARAIMEWEKARAFDRFVRDWPTVWLNAWACDPLYNLLRADLPKAREVMMEWRGLVQGVDPKALLPARSVGVCESASTFAVAYLAVVDDTKPLTLEAHNDFTNVFMPPKKKIPVEFFKLLAATCRKNEVFKTMEMALIKSAAQELEHGSAIEEALAIIAAGQMVKENVDKYVQLLPVWQSPPGCRPVMVELVSLHVRKWLVSFVADLEAQHNSGDRELSEMLSEMTQCRDALSAFLGKGNSECDAAHGKALLLLTEMSGKSSAAFMCELASGDYEDLDSALENKSFVGRVDSLRGHTVENQEGLTTVMTALAAKLESSLCNISVESSPVVMQLLRNTLALNFFTKTHDEKLMKSLVERGVAAFEAFIAWEAGNSKANLASFNKAVLSYQAFSLPTGQQSEAHVRVLRSCLVGLTRALEAHIALQIGKASEASKELGVQMAEYRQIAGGLRNGTSWKADIDEHDTLADILALANAPRTGLLAGPGSKVTQAKDELLKVFRKPL